MSTILFRRPARRQPPEMPSGELSLQEPPAMVEEPSGNLATLFDLPADGARLVDDDPALHAGKTPAARAPTWPAA